MAPPGKGVSADILVLFQKLGRMEWLEYPITMSAESEPYRVGVNNECAASRFYTADMLSRFRTVNGPQSILHETVSARNPEQWPE